MQKVLLGPKPRPWISNRKGKLLSLGLSILVKTSQKLKSENDTPHPNKEGIRGDGNPAESEAETERETVMLYFPEDNFF